MNGREGTAENKSSFEGSANDSRNLTKNREEMAKNIVKDLTIKAKEQKSLNHESDRLSINILKRIYNGHPIAKEIKQEVITYLNRRIIEIESKVREGQALTCPDRQFMREILDISKDYHVKELEIEWFKENRPLDQIKKGKMHKVDAKLIKEFTAITRTYWDKILLLSLTGLPGYIAGLLIENYRFRRIDKGLKKYDLSIHDLFEFVLSFQNSAVAKAEQMIFENRKIVRKERDRYQDNKNGAIDELHSILTNKNAPKLKVADRLRAKGLIRCVKNRPSLKMEFLISTPFFCNIYYKEILRLIISNQSESKIAEFISRFSPNVLEDFAVLIESYNPVIAGITKLVKPNAIRKKYSEFEMARLMDSITLFQMKAIDASKHPILNDINTDFLGIARRFRNNQQGFKEEIIKILNNREKSAYNTLNTLYKDPSKVWELKPLIELTMADEKIEKGDKAGQLIWDRVKDVGRGNTIRSIGMAAMGIGLGIAGFFTGGSAWAGLALAAGGATVSGIDLYHELDAYKLHSNAAKATLGGEISDDPGVLGVTLAVLSLVVDIGSLGQAIKTINDSAKLIAASGDAANTAQEAGKLFEKLKTTEKIGNVTEDEFIKTIQEAKEGIQLPKNDDIIKASKTLKSSDGDVDRLVAASRETAVTVEKPISKEIFNSKKSDSLGINKGKSKKTGVTWVDDVLEANPFDDVGNLKPNIKYQTGEFNYLYKTDDLGRISKFETDNLQHTTRDSRLAHNSNTPGKLDGDHAGHLAGDRFGGSPKLDNLVSQSSDVNLSQYRKIEEQWAKAIEEGKKVKVNIEITYEGNSMRTSEFNIQYEIDGKYFERDILN